MGHRNPRGEKPPSSRVGGAKGAPQYTGKGEPPCQDLHPPRGTARQSQRRSHSSAPRAPITARVSSPRSAPLLGCGGGRRAAPPAGRAAGGGGRREQRPLLEEPGRAAPPAGGRGQRTGGHVLRRRRSPGVRLPVPSRAQPRMGPALHPPGNVVQCPGLQPPAPRAPVTGQVPQPARRAPRAGMPRLTEGRARCHLCPSPCDGVGGGRNLIYNLMPRF